MNTINVEENERATKVPAEEIPHFGGLLAEKFRATVDAENLTDFEKFVLDRGYEYKTEAALKAGYDRTWKAGHGITLTAEEFAAEVGSVETAGEVYDVLSTFVREKKISAADLFQYARFRWCWRKPEAIIAYQIDPNKETPIHRKWAVNNCSEEITEEEARIKVCEEFGFEASRVRIIGTPYYDATDWNFIRFDCAGWAWLMKNGSIYQVCR